MSRQIAFIDFDGTITAKDSLLKFIKFSKGSFRFYLGFLINSPWLLAFRAGIISNQAGKERILTWFFGGTPLNIFQDTCDRFAAAAVPDLVRPKALKEIRQLQEKGVEVVVVSASPANWLQKWAEDTGVALLATRLQTRDHPASTRLTGKILGRNCHGEEKVRRIRESYDLPSYAKIIAYGDSSGDKPMLALATIAFFKPFR